MRVLLLVLGMFIIAPLALGQAATGQGANEKVREELRQLYSEYNEAGSKRDRAGLERVFADDYIWVQKNGRIINRTKHIENILGNASEFSLPPTPSFEQLTVHGDVAIVRRLMPHDVFQTTVFAKKGGRWQFVHFQVTILPPARNAVELAPKELDAFVGRYEFGPNAVAIVTKEGNALMWKGGSRPQVKLLPLSDTRFVVEESGVEMTFYKNSKGHVTHVVMRVGTYQESEAKRLE